jgi:hypothetical protein
MKTEVIIKRELFGREISQKSKSEFFSATDLVKAGNAWRISQGLTPFNLNAWFNQQGTKEFMELLEKEKGCQVRISGRGRGNHTWVHPMLFIDMALAINPHLKVKVYDWIYDQLLAVRNSSGDSYKGMCDALYENLDDKSVFPKYIPRLASKIKGACGVRDWNSATEEQLKLRDTIQTSIQAIAIATGQNQKAIEVGITRMATLK